MPIRGVMTLCSVLPIETTANALTTVKIGLSRRRYFQSRESVRLYEFSWFSPQIGLFGFSGSRQVMRHDKESVGDRLVPTGNDSRFAAGLRIHELPGEP